MSALCHGCGTQIDEDEDVLCGNCKHDDAIRRECAERAWDWFCGKSKEDNFPAKKELLTAAILGKEAEK